MERSLSPRLCMYPVKLSEPKVVAAVPCEDCQSKNNPPSPHETEKKMDTGNTFEASMREILVGI